MCNHLKEAAESCLGNADGFITAIKVFGATRTGHKSAPAKTMGKRMHSYHPDVKSFLDYPFRLGTTIQYPAVGFGHLLPQGLPGKFCYHPAAPALPHHM